MNRAQRRHMARSSRSARKRGTAPASSTGMPADVARDMQAAIACHRAGDAARAATLYRSVLDRFPDQPDALHYLGLIASGNGDPGEGLALIDRSIRLDPRNAIYHNNRGNVLQQMGKGDAALEEFRRAARYAPHYAVAHNNLGLALNRRGDLAGAEKSFCHAIAADPAYADAYGNLGTCVYYQGRLDEAETVFEKAIAVAPALPALRNSLAKVLGAADRIDDAIAACRAGLEIDTAHAPTLQTLARLLEAQCRLTEAEEVHRAALAADPNNPIPWNNFGNLMRATARYEEATAAYRKALELAPATASAHSNLLFSLAFDPDVTPAELCAEARRWNALHATPIAGARRPHGNRRDPDRRLRVGYVSSDFREHAVGTFLVPLYEAHDRAQVEVFSYADILNPDARTAWFESRSDRWRNIFGMPDASVAQLVREDGIDVLIDLAGHTAGNRLLTFAAYPAPVQASWLGYGGTTGMDAIGWRITDVRTEPPGGDANYCERLIRLPQSLFCYRPDDDAPPVAPLPAADAGHVTFGSFNNLTKVNRHAIAAWAEVLARVPGSRMVIKGRGLDEEALQARFLDAFADRGVEAGRIEFVDFQERKSSHLAQFSRVDMVLDTFPYSGATTTCEALWMGVPVVTVAGDRYVGRQASGMLGCVGLDELIARDDADYVARAVALAGDVARLRHYRETLRGRLAASPLCDGPAFAAAMEDAIRHMWRDWCEREQVIG